ncbi:hypothetical protein DMN91_005949 [Ooceraea biroi]|uniref:Neurotransmitter-gated ion-channel ligand-binding domain-containing protein n=2 Tax=Ooceraea biroi TaxID=2015173 RepID=A0A3L8DMS2_OOCBI|nr:hypothetical protein DMN91_005949 [Ooceraea biroi]
MRILQVFGLFVILPLSWQNKTIALSIVKIPETDIVTRMCNKLEAKTPLLRLKRYLFCNYDNVIRPNDHKAVTNVSLQLMPKAMDFEVRAEILRLHTWIILSWTDTHLTWSPRDYDDITFIHVMSWNIWLPDLCIFNTGDMVQDQYDMLSMTECVLFNTGTVSCVPAMRFISKCDTDLTYWPYNTQQCNISLGSWAHTGEEVDFQLVGNGVNMEDYVHNLEWDFKFIGSIKHVRRLKNDTYPKIDLMFWMGRHYDVFHMSDIVPITLMLLTMTVLWLDVKSFERLAIASLNFLCHTICTYHLRWQLPYHGIKPANIMLFYRDSWALATFALILTALLRKLQDISTEMPSWASSTTIFVLSNRVGRFLILTEEESKVVEGDRTTDRNSDVPESGVTTRKWSWKHLVVIVDWLSFFCVIFTYIIMLIVLIPRSRRPMKMRILQVFGFFVILWQTQFDPFAAATSPESDVVIRGCKSLESNTARLRLEKYLFCDYDSSLRPNHHKVVTNVTIKLMPKMMEWSGQDSIALHTWISFSWTDGHLTWTPSNYDGITYIHVKSYRIWIPELYVYNSGDMSEDSFLTVTNCLLFNTGAVNCIWAAKYISRCNGDYTYWPYDQQKCRIVFGSWSYTGEEIDFHLDGDGILMEDYENNTEWNLEFVSAAKRVKKYECCPDDTFPTIDYTFLLTRYNGIQQKSQITPAMILIFLTLTVLWLDSRTTERVVIACVNFFCHMFFLFDLHWQLPYNGAKLPNILLFYRDSLAMATFAVILTALLRKLQDISMEVPSWISSTTTFVLSNKAGRFLVLNDEESKIADGVTEENADPPKSGMRTKESWRHFAAIIEWLSFFCVAFTYLIILIILVPTSNYEKKNNLNVQNTLTVRLPRNPSSCNAVVVDSFVTPRISRMGRNNLLPISSLIFILVVLCTSATARSDCNNVESKSTMLQLKRHLLCEYDSTVRPVKNNNNVTHVTFTVTPHFVEYQQGREIFELHTWISMIWQDEHLSWDPAQFDNIKWLTVIDYEIWTPDIVLHNEKIGESTSSYRGLAKCWVSESGLVHWLMPVKFSTFCVTDTTWWPYNIMNCTLQFGSWSHAGDEISFSSLQDTISGEILQAKDVEWDLLKIYVTEQEVTYKYNSGTTTRLLSYHFISQRHWGIICIAYVSPTIALMALSLTTLWLEPKSQERMIIANLNFICHLLALQDVHWEVPKSGINIPLLLSFYEKSLVIALFTIILTSFLRYLQNLSSDPPVWISNGTTFVLRSKAGQILLINILNPAATAKIEADADDNTDLMPSDGKKMPWLYVTMLIGRLAFLSVVLAYIVLLSMYFPTYHRMK